MNKEENLASNRLCLLYSTVDFQGLPSKKVSINLEQNLLRCWQIEARDIPASVGPSSERMKELWVACVFICRKWSYAISGNSKHMDFALFLNKQRKSMCLLN